MTSTFITSLPVNPLVTVSTSVIPLPTVPFTNLNPTPNPPPPMAQQQQQQQVPAPAPDRVKFAEPSTFDGSHTQYKTFIQELELFLRGYHVADDQTKIIVALSYMKEGPALEWRHQFVDNALATDNFGTWTAFKNALETRFKDKILKERAREKVESFVQGKLTIDEYIAQLEKLFSDAELTDNDEKVRILQKGVHKHILETIFNSDNLPADYAAYKTRVVNIGRLRERFNYQFGSRQTQTRLPPPPTRTPHTFVTNIHPPTGDRRTGSGVIHGGAGVPMDVDKLKRELRCFGCGETGHMRRDCPHEKRKINIRAILEQLEEDKLLELQNELRVVDDKEKDFADGR